MSEMTNDVTNANDESVTLPEAQSDPTLDTLVERVTALKAEKEEAERQVVAVKAEAEALRQNLREAQYARNQAERNAESTIVDGLKEAISESEIDLDTAKMLAERFGVDPDSLVPTYEVTVTITVRVTGVKAEDEDEAGNAVSEAISVDLNSYGIEYDSLDQEDVQVDEVTEES